MDQEHCRIYTKSLQLAITLLNWFVAVGMPSTCFNLNLAIARRWRWKWLNITILHADCVLQNCVLFSLTTASVEVHCIDYSLSSSVYQSIHASSMVTKPRWDSFVLRLNRVKHCSEVATRHAFCRQLSQTQYFIQGMIHTGSQIYWFSPRSYIDIYFWLIQTKNDGLRTRKKFF